MFIDGIELLNTEPEKFLPVDLNITDPNTKKEMGQCLKKFYFGEKQVSKENLHEYIAVNRILLKMRCYIYVYNSRVSRRC